MTLVTRENPRQIRVLESARMLPIGSMPVSAFDETPAPRTPSPVPILADYVDPETGEIVALLASRSPVDGALIEGVRVERGSGPAVELVGNTLREIRHTDDSSVAEAQSRARDGVRELERLGLVRLATVNVAVESDAMQVDVEVVDLTIAAGAPNTRTYAVPRLGT